MRKLTSLLLAVVLLLSCTVTAFAAENQTTIDVYAKCEYTVDGSHPAPIEDGKADVTTDDGTTVSVTGAPEGSLTLMVVPVPETEKEAWKWIEDSLKGKADPVHTFDIHFLDQDGNRIGADGAVVTINCPHCAGVPVVCSLDTDGTVHVLTASAQGKSVAFTTNGSTYYIMAQELPKHDVEIEDKPGGDVEIDKEKPETGEDVTITPDPDDGKVVDKVVVKDEDGNEIPVVDNGDGTYTYEQPDGDVTVEVTFKDEAPAPAEEHKITIEKTSGGKVEVNDDTPVTGQTVTITTKPNSGKVVDKVTVTDENGKTVKVKDNGDGTYSFEQPDGDVTVKVTFKNKPSSGDIPQTGDTMHLHLWILLLLISGMMLIYIGNKMRKQETK